MMQTRFLSALFFVLTTIGVHAAEKTILIGHAANFSDVGSSSINPYNHAVSNGLKFAVDEFKDQLRAKGLKLEIQNFDYGNEEIRALKAAKDLIASQAVAAIGFYESGQALLAAPELDKVGFPLVSPVASATRLFRIGPYIHPMSFSNGDMGISLAEFASATLKAKTALVVAAANCAYCTDLATAFVEKAKGLKIEIEQVDILNEDVTYGNLDKIISSKKFDVVVVPNHERTSARVVAHLLKNGVRGPFLGGDGWGNAEGSGFFQLVSDPKFVGYCIGHWHPALANSLGKNFVKLWKDHFGRDPSTDSTMAYEAMRFLIQGILKTDSISRSNLQKTLASMKIYRGVTGNRQYSSAGLASKPVILLKSEMKTKQFVPLQIFEPKG